MRYCPTRTGRHRAMMSDRESEAVFKGALVLYGISEVVGEFPCQLFLQTGQIGKKLSVRESRMLKSLCQRCSHLEFRGISQIWRHRKFAGVSMCHNIPSGQPS